MHHLLLRNSIWRLPRLFRPSLSLFFPTSSWKDKGFLPYLKDKEKTTENCLYSLLWSFSGTVLSWTRFLFFPPRMRFLRFLFVIWWNSSLSFFGWVCLRARGHVPPVYVEMGN